MIFFGLLGVLLVIFSGSAMTLHILKEMKFVEIVLWFVAISLFVAFLGRIFSLIVVKLDLILGLLVKIDEK